MFSDLDFIGSALTEVPIEDRSSQPTIQAPSATAFEHTPGPSTSTLAIWSAAIQLHEAVANSNVELATSVPVVSSATLQEAVPSPSVDVGNINDVLEVLSLLPDASKKRLTARRRRTQRSEILTSSPYRNQLMEKAKDPKPVAKVNAGAKVKKNMKVQVKAKKVASEPENKEKECIICGETFD
ncbi:hypothetical protein EVAR_14314_1 [Eumeta japonica]|uniref:Uncharacterized protein n=1 Tax=Eumeta variegata TaxID=151549 RepID=A0A4C1ULZ6_EUMVA|nr:hypothetical protein EVAR_14314_1 [Eumeta japonica]